MVSELQVTVPHFCPRCAVIEDVSPATGTTIPLCLWCFMERPRCYSALQPLRAESTTLPIVGPEGC